MLDFAVALGESFGPLFQLLWSAALGSGASDFYCHRKGKHICLVNCDGEETHCFLISEIQIQTTQICPWPRDV